MAVTIEKTRYGGWTNCYRLANDRIELVVTTDVGPRVMRYGFIGGQNMFKDFHEQLGASGERTWQPRGGHRIWIAPELVPETYALDNSPIKANVHSASIELIQPVESETGLEKTIIVEPAPTGTHVSVRHRIRNAVQKTRRLAPWALTMMAQGGVGFTGFPPRGTHPKDLPPTNPLIMWAFTDMSDPRWKFTKKYMMLRQDPKNSVPQKLGHFNQHTFGAYLLGTDLFVKRYEADPSKTYPDFGACYETFTNADFLEIETLGPLVDLAHGQTVEHVEQWSLHRNVKITKWTDEEIDRALPVE